MFETNSRHKYMFILWLSVFAAVLSPIYLYSSCRDISSALKPATALNVVAEPNIPEENNSLTNAGKDARDASMRLAARSATTGFKPSLEMKENVDFLLTPALLMQEALSEDVIITYPSE